MSEAQIVEANEQMRKLALLQIDDLEKEEAQLWAEFNRTEAEIAPHVQRLEAARRKWAEVHARLRTLRQMFS